MTTRGGAGGGVVVGGGVGVGGIAVSLVQREFHQVLTVSAIPVPTAASWVPMVEIERGDAWITCAPVSVGRSTWVVRVPVVSERVALMSEKVRAEAGEDEKETLTSRRKTLKILATKRVLAASISILIIRVLGESSNESWWGKVLPDK